MIKDLPAIQTALMLTCLIMFGYSSTTDLSRQSHERNVRVTGEQVISLNFINDYELSPSSKETAFVESGDLQIYFDVSIENRVAHNMGVTVDAKDRQTILICSTNLRSVSRPG